MSVGPSGLGDAIRDLQQLLLELPETIARALHPTTPRPSPAAPGSPPRAGGPDGLRDLAGLFRFAGSFGLVRTFLPNFTRFAASLGRATESLSEIAGLRPAFRGLFAPRDRPRTPWLGVPRRDADPVQRGAGPSHLVEILARRWASLAGSVFGRAGLLPGGMTWPGYLGRQLTSLFTQGLGRALGGVRGVLGGVAASAVLGPQLASRLAAQIASIQSFIGGRAFATTFGVGVQSAVAAALARFRAGVTPRPAPAAGMNWGAIGAALARGLAGFRAAHPGLFNAASFLPSGMTWQGYIGRQLASLVTQGLGRALGAGQSALGGSFVRAVLGRQLSSRLSAQISNLQSYIQGRAFQTVLGVNVHQAVGAALGRFQALLTPRAAPPAGGMNWMAVGMGLARGLAAAAPFVGLFALARDARGLAESRNERNRGLMLSNAPILNAMTLLDIYEQGRNIRLGRATQETAVALTRSVRDMREAFFGFDVAMTNLSNRLGLVGAGFGRSAGNLLSAIGRGVDAVFNAIDPGGGLSQRLGQGLFWGGLGAAGGFAVGGPWGAAIGGALGFAVGVALPPPANANRDFDPWGQQIRRIGESGFFRAPRRVPLPRF
jgi:hypothetical protein